MLKSYLFKFQDMPDRNGLIPRIQIQKILDFAMLN